jgi:L-fuculose-phosphate aldolase
MSIDGQAPLPKLRSQLIATSRKLHQMGWVANHDGNISVRLTGNRFLITCTAVSKADVDDASLLIVDASGKVLEGRRKAFSELDLHLAAYHVRPDVQAVVHAHPPYATATGLVGQSLDVPCMPEVVVSLGAKIPTAPRSLPRTPEAVASVSSLCLEHDAMLLAGNGALTLGDDLSQAYLRMELVEHFARIVSLARSLGGIAPLSPGELEKLLAARTKAGLGPAARAAAVSNQTLESVKAHAGRR